MSECGALVQGSHKAHQSIWSHQAHEFPRLIHPAETHTEGCTGLFSTGDFCLLQWQSQSPSPLSLAVTFPLPSANPSSAAGTGSAPWSITAVCAADLQALLPLQLLAHSDPSSLWSLLTCSGFERASYKAGRKSQIQIKADFPRRFPTHPARSLLQGCSRCFSSAVCPWG